MSGRMRTAVFSIAAVALLSKALGFLREVVIADKFGTTPEYDLYLVAIMIPVIVYAMINYAVFFLFVPHLTRQMRVDGSVEPDLRRVWPTVNLVVLTAIGVAALIWILAPVVMRLWAAEYLTEQYDSVVFYCRLTSVMVVLGTTEAFMRAYLNVRQVLVYPAASFIVFNLASILAVLLLSDRWSIGALAAGLLGGLFLQNVYLLFRVTGFRPPLSFRLGLNDAEARAFLGSAAVLVLVDLVNRSYLMIDRYFAPRFGQGVVSALHYGYELVQLPDAIVGLAVGTVVFPALSASYGADEHRRFAGLYRKTLEYCLMLSAPLAVYCLVNAESIVRLVFQRGVFDAESTRLTAGMLQAYVPGIVALFILSTSIRAGYSAGLAVRVLVLAVAALGLKMIGVLALPPIMGHAGLAGATALSHLALAVALVGLIWSHAHMPDRSGFVGFVLRIVAASVALWPLLLVVDTWSGRLGLPEGAVGLIARLAISAAVLVLVYILLLLLLGQRNRLRDVLKSGGR